MSLPTKSRTVEGLREVLALASYTEDAVRELVWADGLGFARGLAAVRLRRTAEEPLARLVRLFLAGEELDAGSAASALAPLSLAELEGTGLLERTPAGGVKARVRLTPLRGLVVASDARPTGPLPADHVIDPGPASETLARVTIRVPVRRALDLCTGSGIQALLAAAHCALVVGTDANPRALRLAVFSAALNGIENVELRLGNLFEPVSTERFDLVVANPPFVISPSRELIFRDSGSRRDELSHQIVIRTAACLVEGGFGHVVSSWVRAQGEHWSETPGRWLAEAGCDAVVLKLDSQTAASHAMAWASIDAATPAEAAERAVPWIDYYDEQGITEITTGLIVMRRRTGNNWIHNDEPATIAWGAGAQLARMFTGRDALEALPAQHALLDQRLSFAPGVSLVERWRADNKLERVRLSGGGLSLSGRITPPAAAAALHQLDGLRTLRESSAAAGVNPSNLDAALPALHDLVRRGYLVISTGKSSASPQPT